MTAQRHKWPGFNAEPRKVASLAPNARNARTHGEDQIAEIARLIEAFGFTIPVLIDEAGEIIAGHGRVLAAQKLGLAEVPCVVATGWSDAQKRAYMLADNKVSANSGWDHEMLVGELAALRDMDMDLGLLGFRPDDLDELLGDEGDDTSLGGDDGLEPPPESKYSEQYGVIVLCRDEAEQQATYERLQGEGHNCKVVTT